MRKIFFISLSLLLPASNVQADEYYRSVDEHGKVQYGDAPAKDAADIEKIHSRLVPSADDSLLFETRRANSKFPVTLYIAADCGDGCTRAHDYLKNRGIPSLSVGRSSKC